MAYVRPKLRALGFPLACLLSAFVLFQNCTQQTQNGSQDAHSTSAPKYGGDGVDGKTYVHIGICNSEVVADTRIFVSTDLKVAYVVRHDCTDEQAPYLNRIGDVEVRDNQAAVIVYTPAGMILDSETTPATQKTTLIYCRPSSASPAIDVTIWSDGTNLVGQANESSPLSIATGNLTVTQISPVEYAGQSGAAGLDLLLDNGSASVKFSGADGTTDGNNGLVCYQQPDPNSQAVSPQPVSTPSAAPVPPTCGTVVQQPNNKNFTVSWTAGTGNGMCALVIDPENQKLPVQYGTGGNNLLLVSCDDSHSAATQVYLPDQAFWSGGPWSSVPVRLVRLSDQAIMCDFNPLTCTPKAGSSTPTPNVDENCDGQWDDVTNSNSCNVAMPQVTPGGTYSCSPTQTCGNVNVNFVGAYFGGPGLQNVYYNSATCAGTPTYANTTTYAYSQTASGTVPTLDEEVLPLNQVGVCATAKNGVYSYMITQSSDRWNLTCQYAQQTYH